MNICFRSMFDDEKGISFIYWPNPHSNIWEKQRILFNSVTIGALDSSGHFRGSDNMSFTAADWGPGIKRRLTLDYDCDLRLYSLNKQGAWDITWMAFSELRYVRGLCGPNGICVYTPAPVCACAPGHEAVDPSDGRKGCTPKMRLVQVPTTEFLGQDQDGHHFVSLSSCKNICMSTCSCMGFTYWQGTGGCYTKSAIVGGITHQRLPGSAYIKLPEDVQVLESSIPHSQPFGPKYSSECSKVSANVTTDFRLRMLEENVRMLEENAKMTDSSEQAWIAGFMDPRLNGHFNGFQARTMIELAVSCVQEDRNTRPNMEDVVQKLLSVDEAGSTMPKYALG
ncbi:hypothetical protein C2845_PM10G15520 [Panicum miliaceum]|uniref:Apple domain-containing protein n=1 Tax=Panicum miliaceum TaxID=4540 RepID=A0A3L6PE95_PANMI|nr:hypothetical protein C2845_PM10G15520 [Panicum miliaceum]